MSATDRELLELAAKAVGKKITAHPDQDGKYHLIDDGQAVWGPGNWNPLTDDSDALRLAVRLNLHVNCYGSDVGVTVFVIDDAAKPFDEEYGDDPFAAARRAIVRAAAFVGRSMP